MYYTKGFGRFCKEGILFGSSDHFDCFFFNMIQINIVGKEFFPVNALPVYGLNHIKQLRRREFVMFREDQELMDAAWKNIEICIKTSGHIIKSLRVKPGGSTVYPVAVC